MYTEAHRDYDSTNSLLSFHTDSKIRKDAARMAIGVHPSKVLDVATGTGDLAIYISEFAKRSNVNAKVVAIDTNHDMLGIAKSKAAESTTSVEFEVGDVYNIKYPNGYFDVVTCSFAVKNFEVQERAIQEVRRVLKKGGTFIIVDISKPKGLLGGTAFGIYWMYMWLFGVFTRKKLYKWLPGSTSDFDRDKFVETIRKNGFGEIGIKEFLFGIAYIINCR